MSLLDFKKTGSAAYSVDDGLGSLWDRAERLGAVSLEMPGWSGAPKYEAEIKFRRPSGTYILAKGKSDSRDDAMRMAIDEALSLGATQ